MKQLDLIAQWNECCYLSFIFLQRLFFLQVKEAILTDDVYCPPKHLSCWPRMPYRLNTETTPRNPTAENFWPITSCFLRGIQTQLSRDYGKAILKEKKKEKYKKTDYRNGNKIVAQTLFNYTTLKLHLLRATNSVFLWNRDHRNNLPECDHKLAWYTYFLLTLMHLLTVLNVRLKEVIVLHPLCLGFVWF